MSNAIADERFQEIERARKIIAGLTAYRENLLTCRLDMEAVGRRRIRELITPPQDDHDRAVLMVLDDIERLIKAVAAPVSGS